MITYPIWITVISLICSVLSVAMHPIFIGVALYALSGLLRCKVIEIQESRA